jgi:hypothetical protein
VLTDRASWVWLAAASIFLAACSGGSGPAADVEPRPLDLRIGRLDRDLFNAPSDSMAMVSRKAHATYGEFYRIYIEEILQGAPLEDPDLTLVLERFVHDPDWSLAQQAVDSVLGDMAAQDRDLDLAFGRLRTLFPDSLTPRPIAFNSGYNYGIFPTDSVLGIGVEWFIGKDHPVIGYLAPEAFPQYVKDRMMPEMMVPSAVKGWLLVHYTRDIRGADVLANLVETGKVMVLLDALLPDTEPHLKFAFSQAQLAWCEANELLIWKDIVGKDQLYSKKASDIGRLMNDGPFTNGFPRESPGHIGEWIGYRMVRSYMEDNPRITFAQLFALDDPRLILKSYKPR